MPTATCGTKLDHGVLAVGHGTVLLSKTSVLTAIFDSGCNDELVDVYIGESSAASESWTSLGVMTPVQL